MKAKEAYLKTFMTTENRDFIMPVYQREYSWQEDKCKILIDDLWLNSKDNKSIPDDADEDEKIYHFFGNVVVVQDGDGDFVHFLIIDGQQRVTTVSLLMIAIRERLKKDGIGDCGCDNWLITEDNHCKLNLTLKDRSIYETLVAGNPLEEKDKKSRLAINYSFFESELDKYTSEYIVQLMKAIERLQIVVVNIVPLKGDDPQRVFESLNSKQEKLLETDKIRNFVLMGAKPQKQEQLYKKYWIPIEERVLQKDRDTFFRYYLVVNAGSLPNEDKVY